MGRFSFSRRAFTKVPIIITQPPPEFGELTSSPEFRDENAMDSDLTYVPGFSELRLARDKAIVEVINGRLPAKEVPTLPRHFRWERCQNKKGDPDSRPTTQAGNNGYKIVTKEEVGEGKIVTALPPGAHYVGSEIRLGDTVLMVTDARRAARNEFQQRERTARATKGAEGGFAAALEAMGAKSPGAAPFIRKEVGQPVRLSSKQKAEGKEREV